MGKDSQIQKAFESIEMVDLMMIHESGTKFYQIALFWPMVGARGRIDTSKRALLQTRWGSVASSLSGGGSFGTGQLMSCAPTNNIASEWNGLKNCKERRGYVIERVAAGDATHSVGKEGYKRARDLGFLDRGYSSTVSNFFEQFEQPKELYRDENGHSFYFDEIGNAIYIVDYAKEPEKLEESPEKLEQPEEPKIQKIRSPLFGSW